MKEELFLQSIIHTPTAKYTINKGKKVTIVLYGTGEIKQDVSVTVEITGEESEVSIIGILRLEGASNVHIRTMQHHATKNTKSNLLIKSVLAGSSQFFFDGAIRVEKEGQKTDAYQRNENLLLSPGAWAESKPSLEILTNDVRCTHGATIASLDPEQLFFLESRGISEASAQEIIIQGFLLQPVTIIQNQIQTKKDKEVIRQLTQELFLS
jgi:Fe-S cluster assembly protein SufD